MNTAIDSCLILLTYKGKVLLLQQDDIFKQLQNNTWHLIEKRTTQDQSTQEAITQEVERETHIRLEDVSLLMSMSSQNRREYLFHAQLTDSDVNRIQRAEGRIIQFFTLRELKKLPLAASTNYFLTEDKTLQNLPLS